MHKAAHAKPTASGTLVDIDECLETNAAVLRCEIVDATGTTDVDDCELLIIVDTTFVTEAITGEVSADGVAACDVSTAIACAEFAVVAVAVDVVVASTVVSDASADVTPRKVVVGNTKLVVVATAPATAAAHNVWLKLQ
jgi:hypothetical protein